MHARISVRIGLTLCVCLLGMAISVQHAFAQSPHDQMRRSLVYLKADGKGDEGSPVVGQRITEHATGVIISPDGLVLTTYHLIGGLLDKSVDGQTVVISANIAEKSQMPRFTNVTILNTAPLLDLMLLKIPSAIDPYVTAYIGSASELTTDETIYTSGFPESANYITDSGHLNSRDGPRGHLWTVSTPFAGGQSGSPVYDREGRILGIAKGDNQQAPNQNYMIPIQFADPLIAHLRLADIQGELAKLLDDISPLRRHLEWTGRFSEDGREVLLSYSKLVAGAPHVVKIAYNVYLTGGDEIRFKALPGLPEITFEKDGNGAASREILMEHVGERIADFRKYLRDKPIDEIRIDLVPILDTGERLSRQTVIVEPYGGTS